MVFDGATLAEGKKKIKVPQTGYVFCKGGEEVFAPLHF